MAEKTGLLIGVGAAAEFLGVSRPTIYKYLKLGMPALPVPTEGGRFTYHFYVDNIEKYWEMVTKKSVPDPDRFPENDDDFTPCQAKSVSKYAKKGENLRNHVKKR